MNLLGKPTIVPAEADFNQYILQSKRRMFENNCATSIAEIMGRWSMLTLCGDVHRELRSIAVNFMSNVKLRTYFLPDVKQQTLQVLSAWRHGSTFFAQENGKKFSFNLIVKHLMSMDPGMAETEQLRKEYITFMKGMASIPLNLPATAYKKALQIKSIILKIMGQKLDVKKVKKGCEDHEENDLLASVAAQPNLTRDQILDLILIRLFTNLAFLFLVISLARKSSPPMRINVGLGLFVVSLVVVPVMDTA